MAINVNLRRVDYVQTGTTSKKCMALLPAGGSALRRVVVAAHNGVVMGIARKAEKTTKLFQTQPSQKIECMSIGGALGSAQDKIFVACGGMIRGISKKGREFFRFETNLTENIAAMYVYGVDMLLCGTYTFNHYHDTKETSYYLCSDRINDVLCLPVTEGSWVGRGLTPVLACDDRTLKVLHQSKVAYEIEVGGPANVLHLAENTGGPQGWDVLYGTKDGRIGLVELPKSDGRVKWEVLSPTGSAGVTCLTCYDITGDGMLDLIAGRDDGTVEIYVIDDAGKPRLKQTFNCGESVTSVACGHVNNAQYDEIIVCTYSGWVFGLTTEPLTRDVPRGPLPVTTVVHQPLFNEDDDSGEAEKTTAEVDEEPSSEALADMTEQKPGFFEPQLDHGTQQELNDLNEEIAILHQRVANERFNYQENTQHESSVSAVPTFSVNDKLALLPQEAAYLLVIELQISIDYVLLQCDVPVDLLDVEKNSAVVSMTPCDPSTGNCLLATYRCQNNTLRLEIKIRSIEGQYGTLMAYVSPRLHPKMCQLTSFDIKPLSLHQRTHTFDENRPLNILSCSGAFSLAEAHSWLVLCMPEVPDKTPADDAVVYTFESTFCATQLRLSYSKGKMTILTDNISTLAIIKDVISREVTKKKLRLDFSCEINEDSIPHTLQLLHSKLEFHLSLARKVHLVEALKELTMHESDESFLTDEYREILDQADDLQAEHKNQQAHLERLYGIITDLYIDKFKFKGIDVKHKVPDLLQILDNYSIESLLAFFDN